MESGPSQAAEAFVGILIPPVCREHVLGDLRERAAAGYSYTEEALFSVPWVIASQVRRTNDPQLLLIQALALYLGFLAFPWLQRQSVFLVDEHGMLRLAVPSAAGLIALIFASAYADPRRRSLLRPARQAVFAVGLTFLVESVLLAMHREWGVPFPIMLYGGLINLIAISALRYFFINRNDHPTGAG